MTKLDLDANLHGTVEMPGDKSISHRAIIFSSIGESTAKVENCLLSDDVLATIDAFKCMGVNIQIIDKNVIIDGVGLYGLKEPSKPIDCGNSGTTCRLLTGLLSMQSFKSMLVGDASLSKRPMKRVTLPLKQMGARINTSMNGTLPIEILPAELNKTPINYKLEIPSAQIFTSLLLASLYCNDASNIHCDNNFRDHTQRFFDFLNIPLSYKNHTYTTQPIKSFTNRDLKVPGDFSSAAFFIVLGVLTSDKGIIIKNVNLNPTRDALIGMLKKMGADITINHSSDSSYCEPVADILCKKSALKGTEFNLPETTIAIDEIPILAIACAFADGISIINNIAELRVKESDRISAISKNLNSINIQTSEKHDSLTVLGGQIQSGPIKTYHDHRIAMSFLIASLAAKTKFEFDDVEIIKTSFPNFFETLELIYE